MRLRLRVLEYLQRLRKYSWQLRPWKWRVAALLLLGLACPLFWMLRTTEPALLTVSSLLLNYMLVPATVLLVVALSAACLAPWNWARVLFLLAGGANIAVAGSACLTIADPVNRVGVAWAVVALVVSIALIAVVSGRWLFSMEFKRSQVAVVVTAVFALLPLIQFWHVSSFQPSRQDVSLDPVVTVDAVRTASGVRGEVTVKLMNTGDVGAVVLGSRLLTCQGDRPPPEFIANREPRRRPTGDAPVTAEEESAAGERGRIDPPCIEEVLFDTRSITGTVVDPGSTWVRSFVLKRPETAPADVRLVLAEVSVEYARRDRLKIEVSELEQQVLARLDTENCKSPALFARRSDDSGQGNGQPTVRWAKVFPDSRTQGVVQEDVRIVYVEPERGLVARVLFAVQPVDVEVCDGNTGRPAEYTYLNERYGLEAIETSDFLWLPEG